jgi:dTDP-glucose 4,6-dehydratase
MDLLVIGGNGFVGANFIQYILEKYHDYNVICIDKHTNENIEKTEKFHFYQVDFCNIEEVLKVFKFWYSFDIIVNFAEENNENIIDSNIYGVYKIFEIIKKYKVKHFLQVSTTDVYDILNDEQRFAETSNTSLYSASKASADLIALSYFHSFKIPVVVSRCSNNFGIYQNTNEFIPSLIINALTKKKLIVYEDDIRNWINVLDHCRALDTLMHYGKFGEIYNIKGNRHSSLEIARLIMNYLNLPLDMLEVRSREYSFKSEIDYSKIGDEFGWKPVLDFKESLIDTIESYRTNFVKIL